MGADFLRQPKSFKTRVASLTKLGRNTCQLPSKKVSEKLLSVDTYSTKRDFSLSSKYFEELWARLVS